MKLSFFSRQLSGWWSRWWPDCLSFTCLALLCGVITVTNYRANTWLTGWDNLHPEFDFSLNVGRSLSATWQEYQGLGLLGGMSHAADLPRQLILWLGSLFLPTAILRYVWHLGMVWLGAFGSYVFIKHLLKSTTASLVGAVFYVANLATVQYFFTPYEAFSSFYGFLPWLLWSGCQILEKVNLRRITTFLMISVLAAPAFYVQTLFVVYAMVFGVFILETILKNGWAGLKRATLVVVLLLISQGFWLFPSLYATATNSGVTVHAKINQLSTPEAQIMNQHRGTPFNIATLRGYWLDYQDVTVSGETQPLMSEWLNYLNHPYLNLVVVGLFVLTLLGYGISLTKPNLWRFSPLIILGLCLIMMTSGADWFGKPYQWLADHIPLFGQIFRTSFTKWSVVTALFYAIGIGLSIRWVLERRLLKGYLAKFVITVLVSTLILFPVWPIFTGHLIADTMRLPLPTVYQDLFIFLKNQPKTARIVTLPLHTMWGWDHHTWGYRGSGFIWYGIEQPIMHRSFDVWSESNETAYVQLNQAVKSNDLRLISETIAKYQLSLALIDESVFEAGKPDRKLDFDETHQVLQQLGAKKIWSKDFLSLYDLSSIKDSTDNPITSSGSFLVTPQNFHVAQGQTTQTRRDIIYESLGPYVDSHPLIKPQFYPFSQLFQEKNPAVSFLSDEIVLPIKVPDSLAGYQLQLPSLASGSTYNAIVEFQHHGDVIDVNFKPPFKLQTSEGVFSPQSLPSLKIKPTKNNSYQVVQISNQEVSLIPYATAAASLNLVVGSSISFDSFSPDDVYQNQGVFSINSQDVASTSLAATAWQAVQSSSVITLPSYSQARILVPTVTLEMELGSANISNCSLPAVGSINSIVTPFENRYYANDFGVACASLFSPQVKPDTSYLLTWQGENKQGRSLRTYVSYPSTSHVQIDQLLPSQKFIETHSLLPVLNSSSGAVINWSTHSYGDPATNILQNITLRPYNLEYLARLALLPTEQLRLVNNDVSVSDTKKLGTFGYVTTATNSRDNGILVLSQGYNSGWVAFKLPEATSYQNVFSRLLAFSDYQQLSHSRFNSWENSWAVPIGKSDILIFYWPQLLSWFGFACLILTTLILIFSTLKVSFKRYFR